MRAPSELTKPRITRQSGAVALLLLALTLSAYMISIDLRNTLRYGGTDMRGPRCGMEMGVVDSKLRSSIASCRSCGMRVNSVL